VHREIQGEYGLPGQAILTMPILVGLDGSRKMSKSLGNYVGIIEAPNAMFKNIMRISDSLMWSYLELLTDRSTEAIKNLQRNVEAGTTHPKQVKLSLANEIVRGFHGEGAATKAQANWVTEVSLGQVSADAPIKSLPEDNYIGSEQGKMKLSRALVRLGATDSRAKAERLIKDGAVEIDNVVISDPTFEFDLNVPKKYLLKVGKQKFYFVVQ
jgi:tyrosyl-tRNA synthetase